MHETLVPDAAAPSEARQMADTFLSDSSISPGVRRRVQLIVSELVTNAVQHGGPPIDLELTVEPDRVVVEVTDWGSQFPPRLQPTTEISRGRGLFIVEQLSTRWGTRSHRVGKTVWCDVSTASTASSGSSY